MSTMTLHTPDSAMAASIADDFIKKGLAVPDIKRIIFNTGTKTVKPAVKDENGNEIEPEVTRPALATIIEFVDGSKTTVVNSDTDPLHLDENGRPSEQDKENGIAHALAKTLLATKIKDGRLGNCTRESAGYGRIMRDLVKNAYDQQAERAKREAQKLEARKRHDELVKKAAERRSKNPSLRQCVIDLQEAIKLLTEDLNEMKAARQNG